MSCDTMHRQWKEIIEFCHQIGMRCGGILKDRRSGRLLDPGQAICAEVYGPDWFHSEGFKALDRIPPNEPPEEVFYQTAKRMASGWLPEWAAEKMENGEKSCRV